MIHSSAALSECGVYRYELRRVWDAGPLAMWLMLNPSTADASLNDPTVVRCAGFARSAGHGGFIVCNLFGRRTPDPNLLSDPTLDAVGPDNDTYIEKALTEVSAVVCAWGANPLAVQRADVVIATMRRMYPAVPLLCLGTTKAGAPRHPLYLPLTSELVPYTHGGVDEDHACW